MAEERTRPDPETEEVERDEAHSGHAADRPPTADEERAAEQADDLDPAVAKSYKEAIERGADLKGEGEIS
jgi:hypothetical protein